MRRFHLKRNISFCPTINIDRLWSLFPEGVYEKAKEGGSDQAPVIDVTKLVCFINSIELLQNQLISS
jgi:large subunit ribosomal protein L27Ae